MVWRHNTLFISLLSLCFEAHTWLAKLKGNCSWIKIKNWIKFNWLSPSLTSKMLSSNKMYHVFSDTLYGKGVYFAKEAEYSARSQYSPPGPTGLRHMYVARVLVGDYTVGKKDIIVPPSKTRNDPTDTYDSVVDQMPNPEIFVVFHDPQCYPEYLITFQ